MEGNSTWHDLGGWICHSNCGFQNAIKAPVDTQTIQFDVTFTSFLAVFGGACEKYIPLFVMEGLYGDSFTVGEHSERYHVPMGTLANGVYTDRYR